MPHLAEPYVRVIVFLGAGLWMGGKLKKGGDKGRSVGECKGERQERGKRN